MPQQSRLVFLLAFLALVVLEIVVLIKAGGLIGFWGVLAIVVGSAVGGLALVRLQGLRAMRHLNDAVEAGRRPIKPVIEGALVIFAGLLLVTPGLICDAAGLLLLVPWVRSKAADLIARTASFSVRAARMQEAAADRAGRRTRDQWAGEQRADGDMGGDTGGDTGAGARRQEDFDGGPVIEGEFERLDERPMPARGTAPPRRNEPR